LEDVYNIEHMGRSIGLCTHISSARLEVRLHMPTTLEGQTELYELFETNTALNTYKP